MWEHVPLAWELISLATSESTQELLAEKEIFHKVKCPLESLGPVFLLSIIVPNIARKFKMRIMQHLH